MPAEQTPERTAAESLAERLDGYLATRKDSAARLMQEAAVEIRTLTGYLNDAGGDDGPTMALIERAEHAEAEVRTWKNSSRAKGRLHDAQERRADVAEATLRRVEAALRELITDSIESRDMLYELHAYLNNRLAINANDVHSRWSATAEAIRVADAALAEAAAKGEA